MSAKPSAQPRQCHAPVGQLSALFADCWPAALACAGQHGCAWTGLQGMPVGPAAVPEEPGRPHHLLQHWTLHSTRHCCDASLLESCRHETAFSKVYLICRLSCMHRQTRNNLGGQEDLVSMLLLMYNQVLALHMHAAANKCCSAKPAASRWSHSHVHGHAATLTSD